MPLLLLAVLSATCVFTPTVKAVPADFVTRSGRNFILNGQTWNHIGMNCRGMVAYGTSVLPYAPLSDQDVQLQAMKNMGVRVVRVFAANNTISRQDAANKNYNLVCKAYNNYGIRVLISFTDFYNNNFHPQGDDGYYSYDGWGSVLNQAFFTDGYKTNYMDFVRKTVTLLKNHPGVFAWEIGNELKTATFSNSSPETLITFATDVVNQIRGIDPNHMITTGIITWKNCGFNQDQARRFSSIFDFLNSHRYSNDDINENDLWLAAEQNKPFILGEAGKDGDYRGSWITSNMDWWFGNGAQAYYQWGLMATGNRDNGDGDSVWGMDQYFHHDWQQLFDAYKNKAASFGSDPPPPPPSNDTLGKDQALPRGSYLTSQNGVYNFCHQLDGNVVLYHGSQWIWQSGTAGRATTNLVMQGDGNLVLYNNSTPVWWSGTAGSTNNPVLVVQNDGNVVIYICGTGTAVWSTGTSGM